MRPAADHLVLARYGREPRAALKTVRLIEDNGGEAPALGADLTSVDNIGELFDLVDTELAEGSLEKLDLREHHAGDPPDPVSAHGFQVHDRAERGRHLIVMRLSAARMAEQPESGEERGVMLCTVSVAALSGQVGQAPTQRPKPGWPE